MRIHALNLDSVKNVTDACSMADQFPGIWYAVVFDLKTEPRDYLDALLQLKAHGARILGCPFDSTTEAQIHSASDRRDRLKYWFPRVRAAVDMFEFANEWNLPELDGLGMEHRMSDACRYLRVNGAKTCLTTYLTCDDPTPMWNRLRAYAAKYPDACPHFAAWSYYKYWNGVPDSWDSVFKMLGSVFPQAEWLGFREYGVQPFGTRDDRKNGRRVRRTAAEILAAKSGLVTYVETLPVAHTKYIGWGGYWDASVDVFGDRQTLRTTFETTWKK